MHRLPLRAFTETADRELTFHRVERPSDEEVTELLASIRARVLRHLAKQGFLEDAADVDALHEEAPLLASCYATSIAYRQTLGKRPGAPLHRRGRESGPATRDRTGALHAHLHGFDLHAGLTVAAQRPEGRIVLEKLLRYCARPPIAQDRLQELPDGRIALELKTPWADGSTHVLYEPLDLIAKLAALIPRPHKNLVLYHGVLSANAALRSRVVAYGRELAPSPDNAAPSLACEPASRAQRLKWAELMRRAFGHDLRACPSCSGKMVLIACILERSAIQKILAHLGLPIEPPNNARASPDPEPLFDDVA